MCLIELMLLARLGVILRRPVSGYDVSVMVRHPSYADCLLCERLGVGPSCTVVCVEPVLLDAIAVV